MLRQYHQSFILPVKTWIEDTAGDDRGRLRQGKAKQLLDLIWDDGKDGLLPLFEKTETFQERVATSTVKIIRSELSVLNKEVKMFGKFDSSVNLEAFDLRQIPRSIEKFAPITYQLINLVAENQRPGRSQTNHPHGRIIAITSILCYGRAHRSANFFARALGIYLFNSGITRRALTLLNHLGLTDSYNAIRRTLEDIRQHSQVSDLLYTKARC